MSFLHTNSFIHFLLFFILVITYHVFAKEKIINTEVMKHTHLYQSQSDLVMVVNVELSLVLGTKEENTVNWKIFVLQNFMLQMSCQKKFVEADSNKNVLMPKFLTHACGRVPF